MIKNLKQLGQREITLEVTIVSGILKVEGESDEESDENLVQNVLETIWRNIRN